ncbi:XkdX family protein, partial [Paeniclostridium sordellii]|nr:XkdX family protein [Paeniclostridium sordellii]
VSDVRLFVQAERITKEQFTEITKESFDVVSLPSNIINNKVM